MIIVVKVLLFVSFVLLNISILQTIQKYTNTNTTNTTNYNDHSTTDYINDNNNINPYISVKVKRRRSKRPGVIQRLLKQKNDDDNINDNDDKDNEDEDDKDKDEDEDDKDKDKDDEDKDEGDKDTDNDDDDFVKNVNDDRKVDDDGTTGMKVPSVTLSNYYNNEYVGMIGIGTIITNKYLNYSHNSHNY